jgi:hypothetical protein
VTQVLASRPLTAIGLISYSWYLWHWPLLAFVRVSNFGERRLGPDALAALVSLVLAIATYWLVERPIRVWRQKTKPKLGWAVTAMGLAACGAMGGVGASARPALALVPPEDPEGVLAEGIGIHAECNFAIQSSFRACMALVNGRRLGLVAGDSHASGIFKLLAVDHGDEQVLLSRSTSRGCSPLFGVSPADIRNKVWSERCRKRKSTLEGELNRGEFVPEFVILSAYWPSYAKGGSRAVVLEGAEPHTDSNSVLRSQLRATLKRFLAAGVQRILIVGPTPEMNRAVLECVAQAERQAADVNKKCGTGGSMLRRARKALKILREAAAGLSGVKVLDPLPSLCGKKSCPAVDGKDPLYSDRHHLTDAGHERMLQRNKDEIEWVLGRGVK